MLIRELEVKNTGLLFSGCDSLGMLQLSVRGWIVIEIWDTAIGIQLNCFRIMICGDCSDSREH